MYIDGTQPGEQTHHCPCLALIQICNGIDGCLRLHYLVVFRFLFNDGSHIVHLSTEVFLEMLQHLTSVMPALIIRQSRRRRRRC